MPRRNTHIDNPTPRFVIFVEQWNGGATDCTPLFSREVRAATWEDAAVALGEALIAEGRRKRANRLNAAAKQRRRADADARA